MERKVRGMDICTMGCLQGTDAFASYAHGKKVTHRNTEKYSADRKTKTQNDRKDKRQKYKYTKGNKVTTVLCCAV